MATHGYFTLHDLYAGKAKEYHYKTIATLAFAATDQSSLISTVDDLLDSTSTPTIDSVQKVVGWNSFVYFYWFLIVLAVFFALLLSIICIYFCCQRCTKKNKLRNEKKRQSLPSFYRSRTKKNRDPPAYNIYESTAPLFFTSPTRSSPSKSSENRDNQLLRQGLEAVGTPQNSRVNESGKESSSTFSSTASDLLTEMKGRLGTRLSQGLGDTTQSFETQQAKMAFNDELKP